PDLAAPFRYLLLYFLAFLGAFLALGAVDALLPGLLGVGALLLVIGGAILPVALLSVLVAKAWRRRSLPSPPPVTP
ncbi:MAG: hypothetical protein ACE5LS_06980, partial [Thermoplasmata archaeon]